VLIHLGFFIFVLCKERLSNQNSNKHRKGCCSVRRWRLGAETRSRTDRSSGHGSLVPEVVTSRQSRAPHQSLWWSRSDIKPESHVAAQDQSWRGAIPGPGRRRPTCSLSLGRHP